MNSLECDQLNSSPPNVSDTDEDDLSASADARLSGSVERLSRVPGAVPRDSLMHVLIPPSAIAFDSFGLDESVTMFPEEFAQVARASESRRGEYGEVRACARRALYELGFPAAPILRGTAGAPIWPAGVAGSMTHCSGYRCAAVAQHSTVQAIGIDAEVHGPLPSGVIDLISTASERAHLQNLTQAHPRIAWDCLLFSAKESVYKAWFPAMRSWLDFKDVAVRFSPGTECFEATFMRQTLITSSHPHGTVTGRFAVKSGLVLTAVTVLTCDRSSKCSVCLGSGGAGPAGANSKQIR